MNLRTIPTLTIPPPLNHPHLPPTTPIPIHSKMFPHMHIPILRHHRFHPSLIIFPTYPATQHLSPQSSKHRFFYRNVTLPAEIHRGIYPSSPICFVCSGNFVSAEERTAFAGLEVLGCCHTTSWNAVRESFAEGKFTEAGIGGFAEGIVR